VKFPERNNSSSSIWQRWTLRYGLAFVAVAAGFGLRLALTAWVGPGLPTYITFYPAVMVAALLAGFGPGLLATGLTALSVAYWILPPEGFRIASPVERLGVVLFAGMGLFMSAVAEFYRRDRRKAAAYDREMALRASQDALRQSEARLAGIVGSAMDAIISVDADQRIVLFNAAAERMFRCSAAEALGQPLDRFIPARYRTRHREHVRSFGATGVTARTMAALGALSGLRADGQEFPIEASISQGDVKGQKLFTVILRDTTERKRAEEELRQSEERYRTMFETMLEGFCIIEVLFDADDRPLDYRFLEINSAFEAQTGLKDARGKRMRELAPEHEARWFEIYGKVALTGEPARFVNEAKALNRWYDVSAYRIGGQGSRKVAILFNDITARKRAETALRESEERLRFALETSHTGAWDLDLVDHTAFRSLEHDHVFGYAELLPKWTYEMFLEHVLPEDRAMVDGKFRRAMENQGDWNFECRIRRTDGQVRWIWAAGRHRQEAIGAARRMAGIVQDITERKLAGDALRESEERHQLATSVAKEAIWEVNLVNGTVRWNHAYAELFGRPAEARAHGPWWLGRIHPEDRERVDTSFARVLAEGGNSWTCDYRMKLADDSYAFLSDRAIIVRDKAGSPLRAVGAKLNVTERKLAEEALASRRKELQVILESVPAMIFYKDKENHFVRTNKAFEDAMGLPKEKLQGQSLFDLYPREMAEAFWNDDKEVMTSRKSRYGIIEPMQTPLGTRILQTDKIPYFDESGDVIGVIGFAIDITERKRAEEALRRVNEELEQRVADRTAKLRASSHYSRSLLEASLDPLVTISPEGKVTDVNQATESVTGVPRAQLIGTDFARYFTEPQKAEAGYQKVLAEGQVRDYPLTIRHTSGRVTDVLYHATVYRNEAGAVRGVFAAARDITEHKRAEAELARYRDHLEELVKLRTAELARSNEDLEQFAYVASHDLQEPLRAVGGYVKLLQHRFPEKLDAKAREYIAGAADGAERMQRLIADLLAFSRVGTRGGAFAPADLNALLRDALNNLQTSITEAGAKVTSDPLPSLTVDATQIGQLFQNLIGNAIKFRSERAPEIHVGACQEKEHWLFWVRDNGIGIEPQYAGRIFQIFQRLHSRKHYPGTGIGLAICKKIVERHGGEIRVESEPVQGSTFYFSIPEISVKKKRVP
jgi:PAS domain S-box-containing protein